MNIKQVSELKGVSADTLRYYERIGLLPPVNRTKSGIRDYTDEDLRWVDFTICMRNAGLSIESIIEYIRLVDEGDQTALARKNLLVDESEKLEIKKREIEICLEKLSKKIEMYDHLANELQDKDGK